MTFTVIGKPQGKARARTFYHEGAKRVVSMTPEQTVNYENLIKLSAPQGIYYENEPLSIIICAYFEIPKSTSKAKRAAMENFAILPTVKPDADNILKVVCDALNGVLYHDDKQIVSAIVQKYYTKLEPKLVITLEASEDMKGRG